MATVKDLERFGREQDRGKARHALRVAQVAGLLPIGGRGGGKAAVRLTAEHCAWFVLCLAALATGSPSDIANRARAFAELKRKLPRRRKIVSLLDDLTLFLSSPDHYGAVEVGRGFRDV